MKRFLYKIIYPIMKIYWKTFKPKTFGSMAIILHNNNILLAKNINAKYWGLPGGKIDGEESAEECLVRELKEELNLDEVKVDCRLGEYTSEREGKRDTIYIFVVKLDSPDFKRQWELDDARWFSLDQLPDDISPAGLRRIKEFQDGERGVVSGR